MRLLLFFLIFSVFQVSGQVSIISTPHQTLKGGIWNVTKIVIENEACSDIQIMTNAEIHKENNCAWKIKPEFNSDNPNKRLILTPFKLVNKDTVLFGNINIKVKQSDIFVSSVNRIQSTKELYNLNEIFAYSQFGEYGCITVKVSSFKVTAFRGNRILFSYNNETDQISKKLKNKFKKLRTNDEVNFYDLKQDFEPFGAVREFKVRVK